MYMYDTIKNFYKQKDMNGPALLYMGKTFTYAQLFEQIDIAAKKLATFVKAGDVVTVCMPNTPECVFVFYAINRIGAIAHMVHPLSPLNQIKKFMTAAGSKLLVTLSVNLQKHAPLAKEYPIISVHPARSLGALKRKLFDLKVKPYRGDMAGITDYDAVPLSDMPCAAQKSADSAGVYLNSGGTSGEPKIIELSDGAVNALGNRGLEALGLNDARGMYMLAVVPMSHGYGLTMGVHTTLTYGAVSVLMPKFDAKLTVKLIKKNKLHFLVGVPNLYRALLKQNGFSGKALRNIYIGYIGGDVAPQKLLDEFNSRMEEAGAKCRLFEGYGLTETTNVCVVNNFIKSRRGSLGKPFKGLTAAIAQPETDTLVPAGQKGEILIAGDTLMNGYLNNPEETAKAFTVIDGVKYVRTGDYGYMDEDGFLYFVQRIKRIIKISGMSVFPRDIEASAVELDGVTGACAVEYSDRGKTKIALYLTGTPLPEKTVKDKIAADLSHYAMPTIVEFIDKIPLTPIQKADTIALAERANRTANADFGGE